MASIAAPRQKVAPFEGLPSLVLDLILGHLAPPHETDCKGLSALSLASSRCAEATARHRLRRVHIRLSGRRKLALDLARLEGSQHLSYVRQIKLSGRLQGSRSEDETEEIEEWGAEHRAECRTSRKAEEGYESIADPLQDVLSGDESCNFDLPRTWADTDPSFNPTGQIPSASVKAWIEDAWTPLARFIGCLPYLTDLVYSCLDQVPACLLSALHQDTPATRLHVMTFSLRSLYQPRASRIKDIDSDEYLLVTSPSLHSIYCTHTTVARDLRTGYNLQAVLRMVSGLAPKLVTVTMCNVQFGGTLEYHLAVRAGPPAWTGFYGEGSRPATSSKGHLQKLLVGMDGIEPWSNVTCFDELQTLKLRRAVNLAGIRILARIAQDVGFRSLRTLHMEIMPLQWEASEDIHDATMTFFTAFKGLQDVYYRGDATDQTLYALFDSHGESLTRLQILPLANDDDTIPSSSHQVIVSLASKCPHLRRLEIPVCRTQGDSREAAVYRSLGQLRKLKSVTLYMRNPSLVFQEPDDGEPTVALLTGYDIARRVLRDALINCALDAALARSIFRAINNGAGSLEYLNVEMNDTGDFGEAGSDPEIQMLLESIARHCICRSRDSGAAAGGVDVVLETGQDTEVDRMAWMRRVLRGRQDVSEVWADLWPIPEEGMQLPWSSFPLAMV